MERSCLGDSCLVKCVGETMRQIQRERWNKWREEEEEQEDEEDEEEEGGNGVNNNKQNRRAEADRWDEATRQTTRGTDAHKLQTRTNLRTHVDAWTHIQKHRRTVAAHTHKHTHRGILVRCCQLPRWYIASCSGSSSTQALLIEGSKARTRRHNGATSLQLLLPRRSTGLNKIRASQESAAPPPTHPQQNRICTP